VLCGRLCPFRFAPVAGHQVRLRTQWIKAREGGEPARRVHFYFDDCPLHPYDGAGVDLGERSASLEETRQEVNAEHGDSRGMEANVGAKDPSPLHRRRALTEVKRVFGRKRGPASFSSQS
jgi:hypothetical protein